MRGPLTPALSRKAGEGVAATSSLDGTSYPLPRAAEGRVRAPSSGLYTGTIRHARFTPHRHIFRYRLFMLLLDLDELPQLFDRYWFWSARRPALACFKRSDYLGDPQQPLADAVRDLIEQRTGMRPLGRIELLTHLRYFGYSFNPVSFYYVYDEAGASLQYIVAEITNTPWRERHAYVLPVATGDAAATDVWRWQFDKSFHVSPFMPMDIRYAWQFSTPGAELFVHMENWRAATLQFSATLRLERLPLTRASLARALIRFPLITLRVSALIYWHALQLWLKRTPFHSHPNKVPS
ncbi:MAG: DUF1365 domain-containing protein [Steroidobacteraceae bacterium]